MCAGTICSTVLRVLNYYVRVAKIQIYNLFLKKRRSTKKIIYLKSLNEKGLLVYYILRYYKIIKINNLISSTTE